MANNKVELTFNSGETEIFNDLGLVKYRGKMYAVLQPENLSKHSMGPNDVLIFSIQHLSGCRRARLLCSRL